MIELIMVTIKSFLLSLLLTVPTGFAYYFLAVFAMNISRLVWGEKHLGHHFLHMAVVTLFFTFLIFFAFFARSMRP